MKQIEELLQRTIGLDTASIGAAAVSRAVRARMRQLRLDRIENYLAILQGDSAEFSALVESVVVVESYFFRHPEAFEVLARLAKEWLVAHPGETLRILSAPCATGEEPYSVVMALLAAGIAPEKFSVEAVDIHANALARARRGIYGANSFRGTDRKFQERYFLPRAQGRELLPGIRKLVNFRPGNILDARFSFPDENYRFIFCRNFLIYLEETTRKAVLERLRQHLCGNGILFLGPAELPLASANGFVPCEIPHVFACRPALPAHAADSAARFDAPRSASTSTVPGLATQIVQTTALEHARRLLEDGCIDEAVALCEASLREHGASAEAYYILGLARFAAGEPGQAAELYRRALYLEPNHCDTLTEWSALLRREGSEARSRLLARRAERARKTS